MGRAQPVDARRAVVGSDVTAETIRLVDRDVETISLSVLHQQVLACDSLHRPRDQTTKNTHAVLDVDDKIAGGEVREVGLRGNLATTDRAPWLRATPAKDLGIRK